MKKHFSLLTILSILSFGMLLSLSSLPHTHGDDWNHSSHGNCPIYQAASASLETTLPALFVLIVAFLFLWRMPIAPFLFFSNSVTSFYLRGPPRHV